MDERKIDAILAARRILKADDKKDKPPPPGYESWDEFNNAHPRGADGKFGSGGSSEDSIQTIANAVGKNEQGYIKPDAVERAELDKAFPPVATKDKFSPGSSNFIEGAQALMFSLDMDKRFENIPQVKAPDGVRVSFTNGVVEHGGPSATDSSLATGVVSGLAAGATAANIVNNAGPMRLTPAGTGNLMASGALLGVAAGAIGGAINESLATGAMKEMLAAPRSFGDRMEVASSRNTVIPDIYNRSKSIKKIADGVFEVTYTTKVFDPKDIRNVAAPKNDDGLPSSRYAASVKAVVTYRGEAYATKYPNTNGWEQSVTNVVISNKYTTNEGLPSPTGTKEMLAALAATQ